MSHYGTLRNYSFPEASDDVRGAKLYGRDDEQVGRIDDVIFDHSTGIIGYAVVDTGGWLSTNKFVVPSDRLRASTKHEGDFTADLTKQQIESLPPYKEGDLDSEKTWADYEGRYRSKWETVLVMHRQETDRSITPTTQQIQRSSLSTQRLSTAPTAGAGSNRQSATSDTGRVAPAGTDSVVISNSAAGIGGRWDTFQARLRERRKEAVTGCRTCSVGPRAARKSADTLKKAV